MDNVVAGSQLAEDPPQQKAVDGGDDFVPQARVVRRHRYDLLMSCIPLAVCGDAQIFTITILIVDCPHSCDCRACVSKPRVCRPYTSV